jgi:hypothetical protein
MANIGIHPPLQLADQRTVDHGGQTLTGGFKDRFAENREIGIFFLLQESHTVGNS